MNRLQAELRRLYFAHDAPAGDDDAPHAPRGVRGMTLGLSGPGRWDALSRVWQGVQVELGLPPPAIAVDGADGYLLCFSVAEPVPAGEAAAFLSGLRRRWLHDVAPEHIALAPSAAHASAGAQRLSALPPAEVAPGRWSAFVTPDLAALFAEDSWLDMPPTEDAQAELLSRLQPAAPAEWKRALERIAPRDALVPRLDADAPAPAPSTALSLAPAATTALQQQDPRRFLLQVMNDAEVDLRLRIEAAKALLPYSER